MPVLAAAQAERPPAVPLITHDPYFSIWSMSDELTGDLTRHWTRTPQPLTGLIRIDGQVFRWMSSEPQSIPAMPQTSLVVTPTRTVYRFEQRGVRLEVSFLSPLIPSDLDLLSRPVSYISVAASAIDGSTHAVQLLVEAASTLATNSLAQDMVWSHAHLKDMTVLRAGSFDQPVLQKSGDDLRIDWGYAILAVPDQGSGSSATVSEQSAEAAFSAGQPLRVDDIDMPRPSKRAPVSEAAYDSYAKAYAAREPLGDKEDPWLRPRPDNQTVVLAAAFDLEQVGASVLTRHVLIAYDDLYSIEYFNRRLRAYWRRNGMQLDELLQTAERQYPEIDRRSRAFDQQLTADLKTIGGDPYAQLATLAFRQAIAAYKLVADIDGEALFFPKENFSNGCISTVDVIYPASPLFLLLSPVLVKAQLLPIMQYMRTGRWRFPFAPHDLGIYPHANGPVNSDAELNNAGQMPVEESGNMLLLATALAKAEGNAEFAQTYWPELQRWAVYLRNEGMDPANQLSTDDFSGHLAHNSNLSIKAILALAGYAQLAHKTGRASEAKEYDTLARDMAKRWMTLAADGDHFRLAFDKPGTWSQKYNLAWDRILDLKVFPPSVAQTESRFYQAHLERFGLPLDSRSLYTKLDWELWSASLADDRADFDLLVGAVARFVNAGPSRVPLTDLYWTTDGKQVDMQARSVVGGVYIPLLKNQRLWAKWSGLR